MSTDPLPEILPGTVPVTLPELPYSLVIDSPLQVNAAFDPLRGRILQALRDRPATAKQLATQFGLAPSLLTYHLRILEEAGVVQIVAQRLVRGIVAKYYARTAQIFILRPPPEMADVPPAQLHLLHAAQAELSETLAAIGTHPALNAWFPHVRLSPERVRHYTQRLHHLIADLLHETPDPAGELYAFFALVFRAPPALQADSTTSPIEE